MNRGNLIIYDNTGKIFSQTGIAQDMVLPHEYPVGIPYIEIPFNDMIGKTVISIDVTDPLNPNPVFEVFNIPQTPEERIAELESLLALRG